MNANFLSGAIATYFCASRVIMMMIPWRSVDPQLQKYNMYTFWGGKTRKQFGCPNFMADLLQMYDSLLEIV